MRVVPAVVGVVAIAAVAAAVIVARQSTPVTSAGQVVGYTAPKPARTIAVIGDSYSAGTSMGGVGDNGWPAIVAGLNRLQLRNDATTGTGYVTNANGASNAFPQQAKTAVRQNPSLVILWGARDDLGNGTNDPPARLAAIGASMKTTLARLTGGLPHATIVVIGPTWINGRIPRVYTQASALEQRIAEAAGAKFVNTGGRHAWFAGNNAAFIGEDGQHPTNDGNQYLAVQVQNALVSLKVFGKGAPAPSRAVPPIVPTVTATVTPPPTTVTATTTAPATATPTVTVTTTPTATVTVLGPVPPP